MVNGSVSIVKLHSLIVPLVLLLLASGCTFQLEEMAGESPAGAPDTAGRAETAAPSDQVEETGAAADPASTQADMRTVAVSVQATALRPATACGDGFFAHDLPHRTASNVERIGFFVSNGSGLAVNDLDNDGDLDLILGNIFGPNRIFWNEGDWQFSAEVLFEDSTRAITTVDIDGDGWLDLFITARNGRILHWRNTGSGRFEQVNLPELRASAYSLDLADLDQDGDLDLVTASYDASLQKQNLLYRTGAVESRTDRAGVWLYSNDGGAFAGAWLANEAQALALQLTDVNGDGRTDIVVGNDFDTRDYIWLAGDGGWQAAEPFATTTMSTMSFDSGDINNNGRWEIFAADMLPYSDSPEIMDQWQPVMDNMPHHEVEGDPQHMANVLQVPGSDGDYVNTAGSSGIEATGWTWSSKFGDLDQDGFLDLYVVNGMQALDIFSHLPNDELVEENQVYRNDGQGNFVAEPGWGLNSTYGGRSMSMADLDGDGDLDIVINNLAAPAQIFENQLCQGNALLVDLDWPDSLNTKAVGATLTLRTSTGEYRRRIRVTSGYLSGDPSRIHFGLPAESQIEALEIRWPDGAVSTVEQVEANSLVLIER